MPCAANQMETVMKIWSMVGCFHGWKFCFVLNVICIHPSYKHRQAKIHKCPCHIFSPLLFNKSTMKVIDFIPELYQHIRLLFVFLVNCCQDHCQTKGIIVGVKRMVESWKRTKSELLFLGNKLASIVVDVSLPSSMNVHVCVVTIQWGGACRFPTSSTIIHSNNAWLRGVAQYKEMIDSPTDPEQNAQNSPCLNEQQMKQHIIIIIVMVLVSL